MTPRLLACAQEGWSCFQLRLRSLWMDQVFFVGLGGGEVDKGRSGNWEFSFGNADLQLSIRYPRGDIRKEAGHTSVDLEEMFGLQIQNGVGKRWHLKSGGR